METRKLIITGTILFLIFAVLYLFYLAFISGRPVSPTKKEKITPIPIFLLSPTIVRPTASRKISISGVTVNDFFQVSQRQLVNGDAIITDTEKFQTVYFARGNYFLITVKKEPFEIARLEAEADFLRIIGVDQINACRLEVAVNTVQFADPELAGQAFPLSFCGI
ncbi:hypothetical protein A3D05_01050 [Candidatus Gottesmanbacteria bacterium RIFCSPHIGHO2_02_FULL_40_24]|uniref:Uncharacterized protein n=1 Tax=Candidatus Gottesmanbacteria bacterium RIFCSPHIGHO2_01_FULL_40_15 TaxID=1798376 RepID=A0A1F5Z005_9BACT|nr:MAG: hypothetical protein A2777_00395 [Candidatus Gottesmanbacteria bacterium RIFCSPHIGHO2_01_FULL_40_15]OGG17064.1 MAG: hypothetical protein A3D05_01050 [Candidatus Gottesmanbacteria bacterium RIFCSPHIGHO2_02_FULL_40_24]OGG22331.1 MAG: hypothetical protein A3B48_01665 [Candidatus Gottesmanbacteria bacterium RIFCSPLOWO2_01_FULL_40_10]OGG23416.1 MAG: hypothetical protein A3E42_00015 [Candidatus Gottesmanbacteria bacterium RIFCSPHIGHO2_12_FULL_40_13]OGG33016.1 MAG: hypothetical protein A3I80_0